MPVTGYVAQSITPLCSELRSLKLTWMSVLAPLSMVEESGVSIMWQVVGHVNYSPPPQTQGIEVSGCGDPKSMF